MRVVDAHESSVAGSPLVEDTMPPPNMSQKAASGPREITIFGGMGCCRQEFLDF
jgi:hypothetical protein